MPMSTAVVGQRTEVVQHSVDARWIMANAAALGVELDGEARWIIQPPALPNDDGTQACAFTMPLVIARAAAQGLLLWR